MIAKTLIFYDRMYTEINPLREMIHMELVEKHEYELKSVSCTISDYFYTRFCCLGGIGIHKGPRLI